VELSTSIEVVIAVMIPLSANFANIKQLISKTKAVWNGKCMYSSLVSFGLFSFSTTCSNTSSLLPHALSTSPALMTVAEALLS